MPKVSELIQYLGLQYRNVDKPEQEHPSRKGIAELVLLPADVFCVTLNAAINFGNLEGSHEIAVGHQAVCSVMVIRRPAPGKPARPACSESRP